jgi:hypothetical protein
MRLVAGIAVAALLVSGGVAAQETPPKGCAAETYRQFDFWVGEWDVLDPEDKHVGRNRIENTLSGCLLVEHWTGDRGGSGKSINYYDPAEKSWHQYWVDDQGRVIAVEGEFRDGAMRLEGHLTRADGTRLPYRMTFTPREDGTVRQFIEVRPPDKAWTVWFDGTYVRKDG